MADPIIKRSKITDQFEESIKRLDREAAIAEVESLTGADSAVIESVLASSEAGEEVGVA